MKQYDVVLISPPSRFDNHHRPPLGLMYVANYYRDKGLEVKILDFPFTEQVRNSKFLRSKDAMVQAAKVKILNEVAFLHPKLVGIGCYSTELDEVKDLIKQIKLFKIPVVVGGIHPSLKPEDFKGLSDYTIQGRLDNGFPDYSLVDMDYYVSANPYAIRGVLLRCAYVLSAFGCPSQCTFCVAPSLRRTYGKIQLKSPVALAREVIYLKEKYKIDGFYLIDDLYTIDRFKVLEFCSMIMSQNLLWGCSAKVNYLDEDLIYAMANSGCIQIDFGIERGTDEALQKVKKGITLAQVKETFRLCKKYKIRTFANFLVGLPSESEEDRKQICKLLDEISPTVVSINPFTAYEGTEIHREGGKETVTPELIGWVKRMNRKYNSIWKNLLFHFSGRYLIMFARSKRKSDYWRSVWVTIKEVINQKT